MLAEDEMREIQGREEKQERHQWKRGKGVAVPVISD
jgi:hypothetical protein